MSIDLTAVTAPLADAAARIARLLPARSLQPALAGVLLRADADGLLLTGGDGELDARVRVPATVHTDGELLVSRRGFADTLGALDAHEIRLVAEGSRLAVRTPTARFALPLLDVDSYPRAARLPPLAGTVAGAVLSAAAGPVAGAASRESALPIFTGVRVRSGAGRLSLVATDRFRMAAASVPWTAAAEIDALVPATLLGEIAKQAGRSEEVAVHADGDRFGLGWAAGSVVAASLATPFPDQQIDRLLDARVECAIEVDADALAAAVQRATPYAGPHGRVAIHIGDGELRVRGNDPLSGESEEQLKAGVHGDRLARSYQARFLLDALRSCAGRSALMEIQAGMRATVFRAAHRDDDIDLRYLVVPMRDPQTGG